jgi:hypothetical protein
LRGKVGDFGILCDPCGLCERQKIFLSPAAASTALVINLKTAIFLGLTLILAPGAMAEEIRLIVRGDDLGMTKAL